VGQAAAVQGRPLVLAALVYPAKVAREETAHWVETIPVAAGEALTQSE